MHNKEQAFICSVFMAFAKSCLKGLLRKYKKRIESIKNANF